MGIVYEAFDEDRGARVALKMVRNLTGASLARFKHEFRALADVEHPNLVSYGELISDGDQWFFTMELIEGKPLLAYVRPDEARLRTVDALEPPPDSRSSEGLMAIAPTQRFALDKPRFDEGRLRSVLPQIIEGLRALHAAGLVHRDVKPSNVLVTRAGRVAVLDFGLVTGGALDPGKSESGIVGTPTYMAPEQADAQTVGPEADWYALGVLLYEALTGVAPFVGAPMEILVKKQRQLPDAPSDRVPNVPADLDALCMALLRTDPKARPSAAQILHALGAASDDGVSTSSTGSTAPFVGRADELRRLEQALDDAQTSHEPVSLVIEGESGVGKSCLVRAFVTSLRADPGREATVLTGRCYEREAVPYKALDGVVDALAEFLRGSPPALAKRVLPTRPAPLVQVFPVLRRVDAFVGAIRKPVTGMDPVEVRRQAFASLRETLVRLGDSRALVVVIDDLQWADADSLALLSEILRPPDAPVMLMVATVRREPSASSPLASDALPGDVRVVSLGRLSSAESEQLAAKLLERRAPSASGSAAAIAREAAGHPLFIDVLARHVLGSKGEVSEEGALVEDAIWTSVVALDASTRILLELLAVAAAPLAQDVLAGAAGVERNAFARQASVLRAAHLVSTRGTRSADAIELYHDRVRTALLRHLPEEARQERHRAIAMALERAGGEDAEALTRHWRGAGDTEHAARYATKAGDRAAQALAFDRAATSYQLAIDLGAPGGETGLWEKLGAALANAGRSSEAAEALRKAAKHAPAALALDLQRRAADQLLRGGHLDEGLAAIRTVLGAIGIKLPRTPLAALLTFLVLRLWLLVRGMRFVLRDASQVSAQQLSHVDLCWSVAFGLGFVDPMRGAAFQVRNLLVALDTGERYRVARAIAAEAAYTSRGGESRWPATQRLLLRASDLARESGNPHAIGWALGAEGIACYLSGRFQQSIDCMKRAADTWQNGCTGVDWEVDSAQAFSLWSLAQLGRLRELRSLQPVYMRGAQGRGDLYGWVLLCAGDSVLGWLAEGDHERVRRATAEAMSHWPRQAFLVEHFYELVALTHADLYAGQGPEAYARITSSWGAFRRSLIPATVQLVRVQGLHARARSAIASAPAGGGEDLLRAASRDARTLEHQRMPWATALGQLLHAGVAARQRRDEAAAGLLRRSLAGLEQAGMGLYAASARRALGALLGGDEGQAMVSAADGWMREQTVAEPERMAATLAPGFAR